jgi:hypothetical protein
MNFTFGIITDGNNDSNLMKVINSIKSLNIPNYEIIIIGNSNINIENITIIPFNESIKKAWITKKKNLITTNAKYENIVYTHDYVVFDFEWYNEFLKFGNNFQVCMNKIENLDGTRFRDWCLCMWYDDVISDIVGPNRKCLLPYDIIDLSKYMYISGTYWVAKKSVMLEFPLDENLIWCGGEDVEWSKRVREKYDFSLNKNSIVKLLKQKDKVLNMTDNEIICKIRKCGGII